ncbi:hypothetical protein Y032_0005g2663 [Ancylostoma ceylanicum]|uniref:Uncharacterized protein n=1 Tax=Ancylostoma ceylanicum TaxID=53326 RepID=A0A016VTV9_9BILA|nr:hypothetical protein Y032_0005g2663 [Ancylostoma ceylanicum]
MFPRTGAYIRVDFSSMLILLLLLLYSTLFYVINVLAATTASISDRLEREPGLPLREASYHYRFRRA